MKSFNVEIKETLSKIITVNDVASQEEAEKIIKTQYNNQEIILSAEDMVSVDIYAQDELER